MDRKPGNGGRKKTVSGGSANVHKRGSGINSGKPVGRTDGYSGRTSTHSTPSNHSSGGHSGGSSYNGGNNGGYSNTRASGSGGILSLLLGSGLLNGLFSSLKKNKKARTIAIILVIALVLYLIAGGSCSTCLSPGNGSGLSDTSSLSAYSVAGTNANESSADMSVSNLARDKRTEIVGGGNDVVTVMVYMCGTDLESKYGMATSDLKEMMAANISDNVNVIVETGGAKAWKNSTVSSNYNQIYKVTSKGLLKIDETFAQSPMVDPENLTQFIKYCEKNYEADRYMLIMWDHGGGSVSGYGYDEKYPNNGSMSLDKFNSALSAAGCTFDFIGFDACLMATLETALVCEQYADYLIASEETEPGVGWYYTTWLNELSKNTSIKTVNLGKTIIDTFVSVCQQASPRDKTTLSIIDLAELAGTVPEAFNSFAASTTELIESDNYQQVSNARSKSKEFSSGINQVDLIDLSNKIGTPESKELAAALGKCIKYNRTSSNIANANGLSIFFPYGASKSMTTAALSTYDKIGLDDTYSDCIKSFASISAGGQIISGGTSADSLLGSLLGNSGSTSGGGSLLDMISLLGGSTSGLSSNSNTDLIGTALSAFLGSGDSAASSTGIDVGQMASWFLSDRVMSQQEYYESHYVDPDHIVATEKGDGYVLSLTDQEWDAIQDVQLNVFFDDGEGYIDLGMDNVYRFDEDGDLALEYDGTWLAINGNVVSYYMTSNDVDGDNYVITGRVPALLTNKDYDSQLVDIILVFDNEHESGVVAGARINYDGETDTVAKGLIELKPGDHIDFLCDYYTYDGEYINSYYLGEQFTVPEGELSVSNISVGSNPCKATYCLTDMYGNELWTPSIDY